MPVFAEDPSLFSKQRLKSELIACSVELPAVESKKRVYLELYRKHVDHTSAAGFSSDEEEQVHEGSDEEQTDEVDRMDPRSLTDAELNRALLKHGYKPGPITANTRSLYEKKLQKLMKTAVHESSLRGTDQYSDSGEEEDESGSETEKVTHRNQLKGRKEPREHTRTVTFPETEVPSTGIHAVRRKPIKGAAGRPVRFKYPELPASPGTLERREVRRRLVPLRVQILVFLMVTCLLVLLYVAIEEGLANPFPALLAKLSAMCF